MATKKLNTALRASSLASAALFTLLFAVSTAFGVDFVKSDIPFSFHVGAKTLPAGAYEFRIDRDTEMVTVLGPKGSDAIAFVTTLGPTPHSNATDNRVVFDKVGDNYTLSEVWDPGNDGVLVHATKGKHEHQVIHSKK